MTRALDMLATAVLVAWWSPTFAAALILAAPHLAALYGTRYRIRRVGRLAARNRAAEAERVLAALRRDRAAAARWQARCRP